MVEVNIQPDPPPRDTPWHRKIVAATPMGGTRAGHWLELECGHKMAAFGNLTYAEGRVLCVLCAQDKSTPPEV